MVLGLLQPHTGPIAEPLPICPPLIGWRARFFSALRLAEVAYVGATELLLLPQVGRPPLAAETVLEFWDYGWPYLGVVLAENLAADATIAQVKPIKAHLYPTARAAVGPYSLDGATLTGSILDGQDGAAIATFIPRFVGSPAEGLIDSEFALGDLPPFLEPCNDPPYWLQTSVTQGGNTIILLLGQTEARVRLPENSDALVRFELLPSVDPSQTIGAGAMTLPGVQISGAASLGGITLGDGSIVLPAAVTGGLGAILLSANGLQLLPIVATTGTGAIAVSGSGAQTLPAVQTAGGSSSPISASGAQVLPTVQVVGSGAVAVAGSGAAILSVVTTAGTGASFALANGAAAFEAPTTNGTGAITVSISGAQTLPTVTTAGGSETVLSGSGAATISSVQTAGAGAVAVAGAGAALLPTVQASGAAAISVTGSGSQTLPSATTAGSSETVLAGDGAALLPTIATVGTGNLQVAGAGAASLPTVATNGTATAETVGIIPILIPSLF